VGKRTLLWTSYGPAERRSAGGRWQLCRVKLPQVSAQRYPPSWHIYDRGAYVYHAASLKDAKDECERREAATPV
jgi:hypothetical protein